MAKQHFYSRVPARVSMFNRTDGFDTFAHSEGLQREFIERELSAVYENKLGKNDVEAVRKGQMPLVYSQCRLRSGSVVQSCVRYLPKDYTGERSAYLCHSLILTEEESDTLLQGKDLALINPEMFETDPDSFGFTSPEAVANNQYPEKAYTPIPAPDPKELTERYDPEQIKGFILALLCVLCAKGKPIFFRLPGEDQMESDEALRFISSVLSVIPFHLRKGISFVSYITDPAQYPNVKIKCVSTRCSDVPAAKGVFLDFGTGLTMGLPVVEASVNAPVNFLYSLLSDTAMRNEFLLFIDNAVKTVPSLERMNLKHLSDLVFLFGGASGLFSIQTVLPTDAQVYDFLCVFEKYRNALSGEYRRNVYKCLERYPQRHEAIPKNIFAKVSRMYPTEMHGAKRVVMNAVLELIHTDIMRDKLFTFLKNNYTGEDPDIRTIINEDLCRVFYGGFLQPQILEFFSTHFGEEPENIQDMVFDKLLLTIRTEAIQPKILAFIDTNYAILTPSQKQRFYKTAYEMLPECDGLTVTLIRLINTKIVTESETMKQEAAEKLTGALEADYRKKEHKLLPMLCAEHGFCCDVAAWLALGQWKTRKIFGEFIQLLANMDVVSKTELLTHILGSVAKSDETAVSQLLPLAGAIYENVGTKTNLYALLEADELIKTKLRSACKPFADLVQEELLHPAMANRLTDVFNTKLQNDGIARITQYASENSYLAKTEQYGWILTFQKMCTGIRQGDGSTVFQCLRVLPNDRAVQQDMGLYLKVHLLDWENQNAEQAMLCEMCCNVLLKDILLTEQLYTAGKAFYTQQILDKNPKMAAAKANATAACSAAEQIVKYTSVACKTDADTVQKLCREDSGLEQFLLAFYADYGKHAAKWIGMHFDQIPTELATRVGQVLQAAKPKSSSVFGKLLGKK